MTSTPSCVTGSTPWPTRAPTPPSSAWSARRLLKSRQRCANCPYRAVLKLERRVSHDGMISIGGNGYSVPDTARRQVLDVHCLIDEVQIFEDGVLTARHALLPGRGQSGIDPAHRKALQRSRIVIDDSAVVVRGAGDVVARRSLEFYDALGRVTAVKGNA
jgi:hypothetical protein